LFITACCENRCTRPLMLLLLMLLLLSFNVHGRAYFDVTKGQCKIEVISTEFIATSQTIVFTYNNNIATTQTIVFSGICTLYPILSPNPNVSKWWNLYCTVYTWSKNKVCRFRQFETL